MLAATRFRRLLRTFVTRSRSSRPTRRELTGVSASSGTPSNNVAVRPRRAGVGDRGARGPALNRLSRPRAGDATLRGSRRREGAAEAPGPRRADPSSSPFVAFPTRDGCPSAAPPPGRPARLGVRTERFFRIGHDADTPARRPPLPPRRAPQAGPPSYPRPRCARPGCSSPDAWSSALVAGWPLVCERIYFAASPSDPLDLSDYEFIGFANFVEYYEG